VHPLIYCIVRKLNNFTSLYIYITYPIKHFYGKKDYAIRNENLKLYWILNQIYVKIDNLRNSIKITVLNLELPVISLRLSALSVIRVKVDTISLIA